MRKGYSEAQADEEIQGMIEIAQDSHKKALKMDERPPQSFIETFRELKDERSK